MKLLRSRHDYVFRIFLAALLGVAISPRSLSAQSSATSSSSPPSSSPSSIKHVPRAVAEAESEIAPGSVTNGLYRNSVLGFTCKIPPGWVLRTGEMNAPPENDENPDQQPSASVSTNGQSQPSATETISKTQTNSKPKPVSAHTAAPRVLLAAFSRPPEARGEEVNSSIVIAAEPVARYPGLKEAAQYFGPLTEVAKAQGFTVDEEPYEIAIGRKVLVRGDFHKDVGTRVMRQSTLAMLARGYAVSFTVIAGTEDDVEELLDSLDFSPPTPAAMPK